MKYAGLFRTWAGAAAYAATTYTTLGDVTVAPPQGWRMLGPIIAPVGPVPLDVVAVRPR